MRTERDALGQIEIDATSAYGIQTARAIENFQISGSRLVDHPQMVVALATVKLAAAKANRSVGALSDAKAREIIKSAEEIIAGQHHDHFQVDML